MITGNRTETSRDYYLKYVPTLQYYPVKTSFLEYFFEVCISGSDKFNTHFKIGRRLFILKRTGLDNLSFDTAKNAIVREGEIEEDFFTDRYTHARTDK